MPGRAWRDTAPTAVVVVLALALVAVSFAPWYGLSVDESNTISPGNNVWHASGNWTTAVVLGAAAALIALTSRGWQRRWILVAGLTLIGVALVLLPPHPARWLHGSVQPDYGWFAYAPLGSTITFGPLWGRWAGAALLLLQLVVAATQVLRRPKEIR